MIQEPFSIGHSWIHRIDPIYKIVSATIFSLIIALSKNFSVLLSALCVSIFLVCLAKLDIKAVFKRLSVVLAFLLLIWITLPLTFEGPAIYHAGPFMISWPGIILSAQITLKSTAILLTFMALIATMTIVTLGHTLNRLRVPEKLVHLLLMTYRYIFVIEEEYRRLHKAIKIRGFRPGTNIHSYQTYAYLIGMLFVHASVRAERVHKAMRCRGFKGKFYTLYEASTDGQNKLFSVLMTFVMFSLIILEYY